MTKEKNNYSMGKVKIILGTYNSQPPEENSELVEEYYQVSYKTFLTTMYNSSNIKLALHYSGALFEWIENKHPEFISVLQEMVNSKQVELLSGGYYDPPLTLLPTTDRVGQMEKLTTYIRKNFGKKPRGCFLAENIWDSSLVSSLKSCGFDYLFLEDNQFLSSGISHDSLSKPVLTEDQGKIITILPINTKLTSMFFRSTPEEVIDYLKDQNPLNRVQVAMFKGELFNYISFPTTHIRSWLEEFNRLLTLNNNWIESIAPGRYVKQIQGSLDMVYFPQYSINGMRNKSLPLVSQKELNRLNRHLGALGDVSHWINSGFFKQFLGRYKDASILYSKMNYVNLLVNQIKGDRSRKKTAREELWRAQSHYVFWHGTHSGIYDRLLRERCYRFLIEAEKCTRVKGLFKSGINHIDVNLDGLKEALYQGEIYNAYISCKGGILYQLDHIKSERNILSTTMRIQETYHTEEHNRNGFDGYVRKMFHDHFLGENVSIEAYQDQSINENGSFINVNYDYDSLNREKKSVVLQSSGTVTNNGSAYKVKLEKKYRFNKNSIVITYKIENIEDIPLETTFGCEMNFSLSDVLKYEVPNLITDNSHFILSDSIDYDIVNNFIIDDTAKSSKINISFSKPTTKFWSVPQFSYTFTGEEVEKIYQFSSFLPQWKIKINPHQQWLISINLSLS